MTCLIPSQNFRYEFLKNFIEKGIQKQRSEDIKTVENHIVNVLNDIEAIDSKIPKKISLRLNFFHTNHRKSL